MERICEKLGLSKRDLLEKLLDGALNLIDVCQYEDVAIEELEACDPARAKDTSYVRVSSSLAAVRLPAASLAFLLACLVAFALSAFLCLGA